MIVFFQCVAEAVAEHGVRGLAEFVPGGGAMFDIAKGVWEKYRQRCEASKQRAEIQQLAQASFEQAKQAAVEAAKMVAAKQPEIVPTLELFLSQIPGAIRQSLKRSDDPTGTTVPATFVLRGPEDVAKLLPPALPRFKPGDPLPGRPGWRLERQLGIGGFGEVWLTRHPKLQSLLGAVKFCRNLDTCDRDLLHESNVIDRLLQQGEHPNIVKLIDADLDGDIPWLMYEYVEGGDLTDLIHEWSGLPATERQQKAIAALKELAETIAHFHRLDPAIVHRDLKPANILRDKKGRLRITDFGISGIAAKHMIEAETRGATTRAGRLQSYLYGSYTPLYASPQQKDGAAPDPRDDVHALGVIGYQMLTGQVNQGVGSDFAQDLKEAGVPKVLIKLLGQCTAVKAERRPRNARAVERAISQAVATAPPNIIAVVHEEGDFAEMVRKEFNETRRSVNNSEESELGEMIREEFDGIRTHLGGSNYDSQRPGRPLPSGNAKEKNHAESSPSVPSAARGMTSASAVIRIIRSILGILAGIFAAIIGIGGVGLLSRQFFQVPNMADEGERKAWAATLPTAVFMLSLLGYAAGSFLGGGVSALVAGWHRVIHAGIIGVMVLLLTIETSLLFPGLYPGWFTIASYLLPIPASIIGGLLLEKFRRHRVS